MHQTEWMRAGLCAAAVCLASWLALALGAGNTGLQRSVSIGPQTLAEEPIAVGLTALVSFGSAFLLARRFRLGGALPFLAWVLLGDLAGAAVLAPLAVGELTLLDAPVVFASLTVLGVQPLAAFAGAVARPRLVRGRTIP